MTFPYRFVVAVLAIVLVLVSILCVAQPASSGAVLESKVDKNTVVRIFIYTGDYYHAPLLFRAVEPNDSRLNAAPFLREGRTVFISIPEMQNFLRAVANAEANWREKTEVEGLEDSDRLLHKESNGKFSFANNEGFTVVTALGTAHAAIDKRNICPTLEPFDSQLTTPRALWEFQFFRLGYGCKVPDFDSDKYPRA